MMIVDICYDSLVPFKEVQEMIFRSLKGSHALYILWMTQSACHYVVFQKMILNNNVSNISKFFGDKIFFD
jgi:hypothetical protein